MSLTIIDPGLCTLVVDRGRPNYRRFGVPIGGAADGTALALGNALVGNAPDCAALEFTFSGPVLEASASLACVVFGAPFELRSTRQRLRSGRTFTLEPGERVEVHGCHVGARGYLCVAGGLRTETILDSRSSFEPLQHETVLPCPAGAVGRHFIRPPSDLFAVPDSTACIAIRVLPGAQADWFGGDALARLSDGEYRVTERSDRIGLRLEGPAFHHDRGEMLSEPVCPGTIQVTNDGRLVVLGVDGQTIGGYPKLGHVIAADLDRLGQLRPGQRIRFEPVSLDAALALARARAESLRQWTTRIRTATSARLL